MSKTIGFGKLYRHFHFAIWLGLQNSLNILRNNFTFIARRIGAGFIPARKHNIGPIHRRGGDEPRPYGG